MIWVTVLTTPARPQYLHDTLDRLDAAGAAAFQRVVFFDGQIQGRRLFEISHPGWELLQCHPEGLPLGSAAASFEAMEAAAILGADRLLYFEDDVVPCRNAVTAMARWPIPPDCGFVAFTDIRGLGTGRPSLVRAPGGPWKKDGDGFWGSQAVAIPRASLDHIKSFPTHQRDSWRRSLWPFRNASDVQMGLLLASASAPASLYGVVSPSLVNHIGDVSAVNPGWALGQPYRSPANFAGEEFDALSLLQQSAAAG